MSCTVGVRVWFVFLCRMTRSTHPGSGAQGARPTTCLPTVCMYMTILLLAGPPDTCLHLGQVRGGKERRRRCALSGVTAGPKGRGG